MRVLVACEESQAVCIAFRERGHEAYSCDIQPCSGGHPEWHIRDDVTCLINPGYTKWSIGNYSGVTSAYGIKEFKTCDGERHQVTRWNLIIAHPPCTHLSSSGARWFEAKRRDGRQQKAIDFFMLFVNCACEMVAIENPVGIMSTVYRKPDQIIQPWQFGHGESKATCLWLKGLPELIPTEIVGGREQRVWRMGPSPERAKNRSKTYTGIAKAMAEQWGGMSDDHYHVHRA